MLTDTTVLPVVTRNSRLTRRRRNAAPMLIESLESRTLLSVTLFVTAPGGPADATHFQTLQDALAFTGTGDTIVLQPGFSPGTFRKTTMDGSASAGGISFNTNDLLAVSEIVSIGAGTLSDPLERDMVTAITPSFFGGYIVTVASALQFNHADGSPVDATNPAFSGPALGINKPLTIVTDGNANMTLPFNLQRWGDFSGVAISEHIFTPEHPMPPPPPPPPPVTPPPVDPPVVPPVDPPVTPPPTVTESITLTANNATLVQGGGACGSAARFTDNVTHKASDFTASIVFSDGVTLTGHVVKTRSGAFEVLGERRFNAPGTVTFTVNVSSNTGASASGQGSVTVNPRVLTSQGINVTTDSSMLRCATVATFTDNLRASCPRNYTVTIAWSDGMTTTGLLTRNGEGTFAVKAMRGLPGPGTLTGNVTISTADGMFTTNCGFTLTIVAPANTSGRSRGGPDSTSRSGGLRV